MTDSPRRDGPEPTQPLGGSYPGYTDPAYASQAPYGPTYQAPAPTEQLPSYSPYGYDPYATSQYGQYGQPYGPGGPTQPPPPEEPKSPRWLWVVAGVAVLAVIGLVIALVIVDSNNQQTVVAPPPTLSEPNSPTPTTSRPPTVPVFPLPTVPTVPTRPTRPPTTDSPAPGPMESVVYDVTGDGRAINITYVDTGGLLQTEFNVMLPWSKEVQLAQPAENSASISIINVGREVNCSITVNGVTVQQRTGAGLTICTATG
jgi:hypothetical protein